MTKPMALIVCGDGINCEFETAYALETHGFECRKIQSEELLDCKKPLERAQLLVIPGGFSFGDEIASGKVLALKLKRTMEEAIFEFVESGRLIVGICNGFQVLTQLGVLPFSQRDKMNMGRLTRNSGGTFINRWVSLQVNEEYPSLFFEGLSGFELPIRHGEGRLEISSQLGDSELRMLERQSCLSYIHDVNGSYRKIAALTNEKGNILGIMPHPEAFVRTSQHPVWSEAAAIRYSQIEPAGTKIFKNIFKACTSM